MAMGYLGACSALSNLIILYSVLPLREEFAWIVGWLKLWMFISLAVIAFLSLMVFVWKIHTPSIYGFGQIQAWTHENPLRDKILEIEANQVKIMEALGIDGNSD